MAQELTAVKACGATQCAFNQGGCTAGSITIGGNGDTANCTTFVTTLDARGEVTGTDAHVATCQRLECKYNNDLQCTAGAVNIEGDTANCATYEAR